MKTFFSLINFVAGVLALLVGLANLLFLADSPSNAVAGCMAALVGLTFLWLATKDMLGRPKQS